MKSPSLAALVCCWSFLVSCAETGRDSGQDRSVVDPSPDAAGAETSGPGRGGPSRGNRPARSADAAGPFADAGVGFGGASSSGGAAGAGAAAGGNGGSGAVQSIPTATPIPTTPAPIMPAPSMGGSGPVVIIPGGWLCNVDSFGNGSCDCGCGVADPDCDDAAIESCDVCNSPGSCATGMCPASIDPEDTTTCRLVPDDWNCAERDYFDEKCDCGCGVPDPTCATLDLESCESCNPAGGCSDGSCPGSIDPNDTTTCFVPEGWTCSAVDYGDDYCHCGCGVVDIDCDSAAADACEICWTGCSSDSCPGPIDPEDNTICTGPPGIWACDERFWRDGSICNCGCGAVDPDCETSTIESCDRCDFEGSCSNLECPGKINPDNIATCVQLAPPEGWTCYPYLYANGSCECGCGVPDIDCEDSSIDSCDSCWACGTNCPGRVDPAQTSQCLPVPEEWRCSSYSYGDGYTCDCGCGIVDPDCESELPESCDGCWTYSGSCADYECEELLPDNNALCLGDAPPEWACDPDTYYDGACDCGCGTLDRDCASLQSSCELCNAPGSCADGDCAVIDPSDNTACLP